jgi:hypothetical protein
MAKNSTSWSSLGTLWNFTNLSNKLHTVGTLSIPKIPVEQGSKYKQNWSLFHKAKSQGKPYIDAAKNLEVFLKFLQFRDPLKKHFVHVENNSIEPTCKMTWSLTVCLFKFQLSGVSREYINKNEKKDLLEGISAQNHRLPVVSYNRYPQL